MYLISSHFGGRQTLVSWGGPAAPAAAPFILNLVTGHFATALQLAFNIAGLTSHRTEENADKRGIKV